MCGLCGLFATGRHWTDGAGPGQRTGEGERRHRAAVANAVLALWGLRLSSWAGRFTLTGRTGKSAVVDNLGALWPQAERIAGRPLDPLDPAVIERIERTA